MEPQNPCTQRQRRSGVSTSKLRTDGDRRGFGTKPGVPGPARGALSSPLRLDRLPSHHRASWCPCLLSRNGTHVCGGSRLRPGSPSSPSCIAGAPRIAAFISAGLPGFWSNPSGRSEPRYLCQPWSPGLLAQTHALSRSRRPHERHVECCRRRARASRWRCSPTQLACRSSRGSSPGRCRERIT